MTRITMLNSMAGADFRESLDRQAAWGITLLDLKDSIFGKRLLDLTDPEAAAAAALIRERGLSVYCLSSLLFGGFVEDGEERFRNEHLKPVDRLIALARVLRPKLVRLLVAQTRRRAELSDSTAYVRQRHAWLFDAYRDAIRRIAGAGFRTTVENEIGGCLFSRPEEVRTFFEELGSGVDASFTWDVQNLWQMGTFPSLQVYEQIKPVMIHYHLKGGQTDGAHRELRWQSALEDASWPVLEITRRVTADGLEALCLNPSHGARKPGYDYTDVVERDIRFLRDNIEGVQ